MIIFFIFALDSGTPYGNIRTRTEQKPSKQAGLRHFFKRKRGSKMRKIAELETEEGRKAFHWAVGKMYLRARENRLKRMDVNDILWDRDVPAFYKDCKTLGIRKITISDQSTGLMRVLQGFVSLGCALGHLTEIQIGTTLKEVDGRLQEVPDSRPAITVIIK